MILLYNNKVFDQYNYISSKFKVLENYDEQLIRRYSYLNRNNNDVFFDRTGIIPKIFKTKDNPLPFTKTYQESSFEDVCMQRAAELLATNKIVNVWWSGGIDSTCVLASLATQLKHKDQLVVHLTHSSIVESGILFEKYIRNNFNFVLRPITDKRSVLIDELSISGYVGNHIMGQGSTNQSYSFDEWELPWQKFINKHPRITSDLIEFVYPIIAKYPKLDTFFDFMRFYMIVFKWNHDLYSHRIRDFTHESFYDTIPFQQWAMYSSELPYGSGLEKLPMKTLIQQVFPDDTYYAKKRARASQLLLPHIKPWAFVLEDLSVVSGTGNLI